MIDKMPASTIASIYAIGAILAAAVLPALIVAGGTVAVVWKLGWPASRIRNVATGVLLAVLAGMLVTWDYTAPALAWWGGVRQVLAGDWRGLIAVAPLEVLLGVVIAWVYWWRYQRHVRLGVHQQRGEMHERKAYDRRARAAASRTKHTDTPRTIGDDIVMGHHIASRHRDFPTITEDIGAHHKVHSTLPTKNVDRHMMVVGATGVGKTVLLREIQLGWTEASWKSYVIGSSSGDSPRPLTIMVDCKGGSATTDDAAEWRDGMVALGLDPRRVAIWPTEVRLDIWQMPQAYLIETIHALCGTNQRYYDAVQRGLLNLVIGGPSGPPRDSVQFLARLDPHWLTREWAHDSGALSTIAMIADGRTGTLGSDRILFAEMFSRLAGDFDAGQSLDDFDALYVSLPGTRSPALATAKAKMFRELLLDQLEKWGGSRKVQMVWDDYSAIAGDCPVYELAERIRGFNASMIASAQAWQGFGPDQWTVSRMFNAMGGGIIVMRTNSAEEIGSVLGTRKVGEYGRQFSKGGGGKRNPEDPDEVGTVRTQHEFLLPPNYIRDMPKYHASYVYEGSVDQFRVVRRPGAQVRRSKVISGHPQRLLEPAGDRTPWTILENRRLKQIEMAAASEGVRR